MKRMLAILMTLTLFCGALLCIPVSAADGDDYLMDWNSVDWENFSFGDYFNNPYYDFFYLLDDWSSWMENEATLEKLVEVAKAKPDAAYSAAYGTALGRRFVAEPQALIAAMAKTDAASQELIASHLASNDAYLADNVDIVKLLAELKLPGSATAEEKAALELIIGYAEKYHNVEIPRTGDAITLAFALMALSGCGLAVMGKRKERW